MNKVTCILLALFCKLLACPTYSQTKWQAEFGINPLVATSGRYSRLQEPNQQAGLYMEARLWRQLSTHFSIGTMVGYEQNRKLYFKQPTQLSQPITQPLQTQVKGKRHFVPLGVLGRYTLDAPINKLLHSRQQKIFAYAQGGVHFLAGADNLKQENPVQQPYIEIYSPIDLYGQPFIMLIAGFGYKINERLSISAEVGRGALYPLHINAAWKF
ncbi:MAG TPA: hypothetical protein PKD90_06930 [Phnomibacter sp.]|nr:hypothetical protein [Phnomibacter sp.]